MGHQFQRPNFSDSWNSENTDSRSDSRKHYKSNIKKDYSRHHVTALESTHGTKVKRSQHNGDRTWRQKAASDIREDSSGRGNRRRPEALDPSLFVSRLSGLTIGEKDGVVSGSCSTLTNGQAPPLESNTAQAASLRSKGKPTPTLDKSLFVQKPQPSGCRGYYSALSSSQPVSKSLGKGSCVLSEPDSGNEIDEIEVYLIRLPDSEDEADKTEVRVQRLPDPEASVKPNIYGQWRPVPERPKRDNTNEMPSRPRMLATMFRGTTDKQTRGKRSSDRTSTALWQPKIKPKIKPKKDKQESLHLACPYTKCDNATQERLFRCRAKVFPSTHRLKQHLYSVHRQKPHCTRCGEIFVSKVDLEAHSRSVEGCNLSQNICIEGFNSTQEEQLRSKKRQPNLRTEEDKWRNIFRILFPDCRNTPDPYYRTTSGRSINLRDVESIFADNVPRELEERLFSKLEAVSGSLDDDQRREVKSIFKDFTSERVRQITEKTGSTRREVMDKAQTIERDGKNSGCLHTDVDSQEESPEGDTTIGHATPNEPVGYVPMGLEPNPVHTDVPSQEWPSGVLSESENDTFERTLAAWNEDMVEVSSYGWAMHDGLDRFVEALHTSDSDVPNTSSDCNLTDVLRLTFDDDHFAQGPAGGLSSGQGLWGDSFAN